MGVGLGYNYTIDPSQSEIQMTKSSYTKTAKSFTTRKPVVAPYRRQTPIIPSVMTKATDKDGKGELRFF